MCLDLRKLTASLQSKGRGEFMCYSGKDITPPPPDKYALNNLW